MHSFQPSRGRILIEVFCALAIVASMVGAWRQTQASALLVAAAAAGLLAMVRLFDLGRRQPAVAGEVQPIAVEPDAEPGTQPELVALMEPPAVEAASQEPDAAEPAPRTGTGRRKAGSRKGSGRRASAPKAAKIVELAPADDAAPVVPQYVAEPSPIDETASDEFSQPEEFVDAPEALAEPAHVPHAPLFEPEPFVRMQRQAFGRRGRI